MSLLYHLDPRCLDMLNRLLVADTYITIQQLADEQQISRRSVYYDLCKINEWLESADVNQIEVERSKGIYISKRQNESIKTILKGIPHNSAYLFSPMERVKIIICSIMRRDKPLYIEDFMGLCVVSRNTIINDLKVVSSKLQEFQLTLEYEAKKGYRILGDSVRKRTVFFLFINALVPFYQSGILPLGDREKATETCDKLSLIEHTLQAHYVEGVLYAIAIYFSTIEYRSEPMQFSESDKEDITSTKEYALVQAHFPSIKEHDKMYLALHLLGSRLQTGHISMMAHEDKETYVLAQSLVSEFSRLACVDFERVEEVEQALYLHLKTSLYRYRYGIQLGNPMLDDIKGEYPELFALSKKACEYLEQQIGVPIPDGEIAYITLHFGGFMNVSAQDDAPLSVLIVCPNGVSTGNMLRGEVHNLVPHAHTVDVTSLKYYAPSHSYDVVISTVPIEGESAVVVHPILTDSDRVVILRKCMRNEHRQGVELEAIMSMANAYVPTHHQGAFKEELRRYLARAHSPKVTMNLGGRRGVLDMLDTSTVSICDTPMSWQEALHYSAQPLLKKGVIEPRYVDHMISHTETMGPYMLICEGVMLAHAKVEEGALHLGLSMSVFHPDINIVEGRNVHTMIVLSAEDQWKHLRILKDIMSIFSVREHVETIHNCTTKEALLGALQNILEREEE